MSSQEYPQRAKALALTEHKQTKPLTLIDVDIPKLVDGEVLIKNVAVAQNPVDAKQVDYDFGIPSLPWTNGGDVSGTIVALGSKSDTLKVGDRVLSYLSRKSARHGGYQEYSIGDIPHTIKIPDEFSHEGASTIPLGFATALSGIFFIGKVPIPSSTSKLPLPLNKEPPILIWGGSASVGAFGIQLARLSGYRVIATASPQHFEYVKSLGADTVIDYHDGPKAVEEIKAASQGKLKYVFDAISESGSTALAAKAIGSDGGVIGVVLPPNQADKGDRTDVEIVSAGANQIRDPSRIKEAAQAFALLAEALKNKTFKPNPVEVLPKGLLSVDDGWNRQRAHQISGVKLVYRIADTPGL